ncbi:MAG: HD domain-containing protein [Solirubrobacteraceae bacterium]|nr:HD domain-containing protein [Solirubrobacteraceae bacterium]
MQSEQVETGAAAAGPAVPPAELEARLRATIAGIDDPWIRRLLERIFAADGPFWPRFLRAPAARHHHEAYPHGLLEHTMRVTDGVALLAPTIAGVDRDVAVAGALLHDIGKADAYEPDPVDPQMSEPGRLEGHIVLGYEILRRAVDDVEGFPDATARSLRHVVLSHHGRLEYGSPVVPATREAILVHHVDDLTARMGIVDRLERDAAPGARWTAWDRAVGGAVRLGPARST